MLAWPVLAVLQEKSGIYISSRQFVRPDVHSEGELCARNVVSVFCLFLASVFLSYVFPQVFGTGCFGHVAAWATRES